MNIYLLQAKIIKTSKNQHFNTVAKIANKKEKMNINQAKQIQIIDFLNTIGIYPKSQRGNEHFYLAPYREEKTPSLSVNIKLNCFYDFGTAQSGDIISLVKLLINSNSVSDVLNYMGKKHSFFSFSKQNISIAEEAKNEVKILKIKPLENLALIQYLGTRKISLSTAKKYCEEMYYQISDKKYFAICFKNILGGYELRNKYSKISLSPKSVSFIDNNCYKTLTVFVGFIDFLSYIELYKANLLASNYLILNSTTNLQKAKIFLQKHDEICLYLDNDINGKSTTNQVMSEYPQSKDYSSFYKNYNDLNDYHKSQKYF